MIYCYCIIEKYMNKYVKDLLLIYINNKMGDLVTAIIPTYNRFTYLLKAVESVKNQTYKNIEIIIVNDGSSQEEYYKHKFDGCIVVNMDINTKKRFGHASPGGFQRSIGMKIATGKYIAFLDDDDYWLPNKIEKQLEAMKKHDYLMSCTESYFGNGLYNPNTSYKTWNKDRHLAIIKNIYGRKNKGHLMTQGFPQTWDEEFLQVHNCCIASSVMIERSIINKIGYFSNQLWAPDYEYWLRVIKHTNCAYLSEPVMYYDVGHGGGQKY